MLSSTFSSNPARRSPPQKWGRVWIGAIGIAISLIGISEIFWRSHGHKPSVVLDKHLWAYHRQSVSNSPDQVVLIGTSRMRFGFSTETFRHRFPKHRLAMLAVNGRYPMATLRDLSDNPRFKGTVICDVAMSYFDDARFNDQQELVDHCHATRKHQLFEPVVRAWLQDRFVVLNPNVSVQHIVKEILRYRRLPEPRFVTTRFDGSGHADYAWRRIQEQRREEERTKSSFPRKANSFSWKNVAAVRKMVSRINENGGKVVFVRFPSTGEHWSSWDRRFPKREFWDRLKEMTGATTVHFIDVPKMTELECPDGVHLDYRDSPRFTSTLIDEVVARGPLQATNDIQHEGTVAE